MCRDNSHHLLKYFFGICLCSISNPLLHVSNLLQNGQFPIFSLFWRPFCYHSNRKSWINTRALHIGYCSNKLLRRCLWSVTFIFWSHRAGQNSLLMHVLLYWNLEFVSGFLDFFKFFGILKGEMPFKIIFPPPPPPPPQKKIKILKKLYAYPT